MSHFRKWNSLTLPELLTRDVFAAACLSAKHTEESQKRLATQTKPEAWSSPTQAMITRSLCALNPGFNDCGLLLYLHFSENSKPACASPLARTARRERVSSCTLSLRICSRFPFLWISYSIQHNIQQIGGWVKNLLYFCLRACSPWLDLLYYPVLRLLARPGTWTLWSTYSVLQAARKLLLMVSECHKYQRMSLGPEESAWYFVSIVYLALRLAQDISNSLGINFLSIFYFLIFPI